MRFRAVFANAVRNLRFGRARQLTQNRRFDGVLRVYRNLWQISVEIMLALRGDDLAPSAETVGNHRGDLQ